MQRGLQLEGEEFIQLKRSVMDVVKATLRPELINRIDEFVVFNMLSRKQYQQVTKLEIDKVSDDDVYSDKCDNIEQLQQPATLNSLIKVI